MNTKFVGQALAAALIATGATMAAAQGDPRAALTETDIPAAASVVTSPPAPARPAEMPPKPPTVTCSNGKLTVVGENSTLGSILTAIQHCLNVRFDIPEESREERTFVHLGPGPAPAVLRSLLESTDDDFVIEPSASNPEAIQSVILMARAKTDERDDPSTEGRTLTAARRAWLEQRRTTRTPASPVDDSSDQSGGLSAENQTANDAPAAENSASTPASTGDTANAEQPAAIQTAAVSPGAGPAPVASNETNTTDSGSQLQSQITNMQQLFQQRQQMVQSQTHAPPPAPSPSPQ